MPGDLMRHSCGKRRPWAAAAVVVAVAVCAASPDARAQGAAAPDPEHGARAMKGVAVGMLVGGTLGGGLAYLAAGDMGDCDPCFGPVATAVVGGQVAYSLGLAIGLTKLGNHPGGRGSFGWAVGGALLGGVVSLVSVVSDDLTVMIIAGVTLSTVGGTLGYWTTHHDDAAAAPPVGALLQVQDGRVDVGVPLPTLVRSGAAHGPGLLLVGGTF